MCSFAAKDFDAAIRSFVIAQAGLIMPRPQIQIAHETTSSPVRDVRAPAGSVPPAGGQPFTEDRP